MPKVKIRIVGSRFQADGIAASVKSMPEEAEVVAVAPFTPGNAETFARKHAPELGRQLAIGVRLGGAGRDFDFKHAWKGTV